MKSDSPMAKALKGVRTSCDPGNSVLECPSVDAADSSLFVSSSALDKSLSKLTIFPFARRAFRNRNSRDDVPDW